MNQGIILLLNILSFRIDNVQIFSLIVYMIFKLMMIVSRFVRVRLYVSLLLHRGHENSSDEPMIYMVVQSKENSVGNYSTEDGTRTFYTELLHWIKEVLSENLDLMKSLLYNDLAEEKAKNLVGLDVTNDWSQESIEILFKLVLMYANREPYY